AKGARLFSSLPPLPGLALPQAVIDAGPPGSEQTPPLQALLALLVPKLLGKRRVSHISDLCNDEGAGLFCGLNVLPKTTYATDYSYLTERAMSERFIGCLLGKTPLGSRLSASTWTSTPSPSGARTPTWRSTGWPTATGPGPP